jgi:hypothetical protein
MLVMVVSEMKAPAKKAAAKSTSAKSTTVKKTTVKKADPVVTEKAVAKKPVAKKPAAESVAKKAPVARTEAKPVVAPVEKGPRTDVNRWSPIKVKLIEAMKAGNAINSHSSLLPEKIASLCKDGSLTEGQVRHQLNPKYDLIAFGYISACKLEDQKQTSYFLTKKGQNKTF